MIRFYSLFVTDDNPLSSQRSHRLNLFHDLTLHHNTSETVNFLLQTPLSKKQEQQLNLIFDPDALEVEDVTIKTYKHQSLITVTLTPQVIGSVKIGFAVPQTDHLHKRRLRQVRTPLASIPYASLQQKQAVAEKVPAAAVSTILLGL